MISSDKVPFLYKGKPATMRVFRNSGYAWGRINQGRTELDVWCDTDVYDYDDDDAARLLINVARRFPHKVDAPAGWEGC